MKPAICIDESINTKIDIERIISTITRREEAVIIRRFGLCGFEPHTLSEIGGLFCITKERVRQIETKALKKLKYRLREFDSIDTMCFKKMSIKRLVEYINGHAKHRASETYMIKYICSFFEAREKRIYGYRSTLRNINTQTPLEMLFTNIILYNKKGD